MNNKYKIYKFTNIINGKVYIGVTRRDFNIRKCEHINLSSHSKFHFHQAIKKYGIKNFKDEILIKVETKIEANQLEIHHITLENSYINGYNMTEGGGNRGVFSHSENSKKKMSKSHMGKTLSDEHKNNISKSNLGKVITNEVKLKLSLANKGKTFTKIRCDNISKSLIGKRSGNKNPSAIIIKIYNEKDKLKYGCHGNFDITCKKNGLPSKALRRSYYNQGKPIYKASTTKKEILVKNKEFIGWYAIKITPKQNY